MIDEVRPIKYSKAILRQLGRVADQNWHRWAPLTKGEKTVFSDLYGGHLFLLEGSDSLKMYWDKGVCRNVGRDFVADGREASPNNEPSEKVKVEPSTVVWRVHEDEPRRGIRMFWPDQISRIINKRHLDLSKYVCVQSSSAVCDGTYAFFLIPRDLADRCMVLGFVPEEFPETIRVGW